MLSFTFMNCFMELSELLSKNDFSSTVKSSESLRSAAIISIFCWTNVGLSIFPTLKSLQIQSKYNIAAAPHSDNRLSPFVLKAYCQLHIRLNLQQGQSPIDLSQTAQWRPWHARESQYICDLMTEYLSSALYRIKRVQCTYPITYDVIMGYTQIKSCRREASSCFVVKCQVL